MNGSLFIDLGTNLGYAYYDSEGKLNTGCVDLSPPNNISPGTIGSIGYRLVKLDEFLDKVYNEIGYIKFVGYERPHFRGGHTTRVLVGLETHVMYYCYVRGIECDYVETAKLKKEVVGKGNCTKGEMWSCAKRYAGWIQSQDEADAVLVAVYFSILNDGVLGDA